MPTRTLNDWLEYIEQQHPKSIAMGLERVREVATRMGLGKPAKRVITVGGTNGKGSTVAFIEAIARAHGWKVGAYTSPHLLRYNERVRIDGVDAEDEALVAGFAAVEAAANPSPPNPSGPQAQPSGVRSSASESLANTRPHPLEGEGLKSIPLTYFEYGTLCALWLFKRASLDLVVLEVGLGGRLDAVNIIDADVAVITTVDLDHQEWLGHDIEAIGFEKAGIARPFKPLVLGDDDPPASVLRHAYAIGAQAWRIANDFFAEPILRRAQDDRSSDVWRWREVGYSMTLPRPALDAPVQLRNAACAVTALRALPGRIQREAFVEGIANAQVVGRLQRFRHGEVDVVVDVGHNPQAARALAAWLRAQPRRRTLAVYAALADKDAAGVVSALADDVDGWYLAGMEDAGPRGQDAASLRQRLVGTAAADAATYVDANATLDAALQAAGPDGRVLVFGSFHITAVALRRLNGAV